MPSTDLLPGDEPASAILSVAPKGGPGTPVIDSPATDVGASSAGGAATGSNGTGGATGANGKTAPAGAARSDVAAALAGAIQAAPGAGGSSGADAGTGATDAEPAPKASDLASIAARERTIRQSEIRAKRAAQASTEQATQAAEILRIAKEDPLRFLAAQGHSIEGLLQQHINGNIRTPEQENARLQQQIDQINQRNEQAAARQHQADRSSRVSQLHAEIASTISSRKDDLELLSLRDDATNLVYEAMDEFYRMTLQESGEGEILPIDEAAKFVEDELLEDYRKMGGAKKLQTTTAGNGGDARKTSGGKPQPTLSANHLPSAVPEPPRQPIGMTDSEGEAIRRAVAAYRKHAKP